MPTEEVVLKRDILDILTVEEWSKFKQWIANQPSGVVDNIYDEKMFHEFLGVIQCNKQL